MREDQTISEKEEGMLEDQEDGLIKTTWKYVMMAMT
jgi:hypothetical protein